MPQNKDGIERLEKLQHTVDTKKQLQTLSWSAPAK